MKILLDVIILIVGFVALIKGADWFVDGAAALAKKLKVPGLIIGLTVVAMGTSAPELAVSTSAAIQGANEIAGGEAVVYGAKAIALAAGMTETLVGLTIVAVGTSLPELVTSIVAARKGDTGMAVGNVVGSNIFNILLILGVSSAIHPITVNAASVWDMYILIAIGILTYVFGLSKKKIARTEGIVMILLYAAVMVFAIVR